MSWLLRHRIISKLEANSPSLDDYKRPLPPPPPFHYWEKQEDHSWELKMFEKEDCEDVFTFVNQSVVEHTVLSSDTIQGICLKYGISVITLRQANMFSGNAFRSKKTLRIPIEKGVNVRLQTNNDSEVILQRFKNLTNEQTTESKFYLEENNYNLESAYNNWVLDQKWASEHVNENGEYENNCIEDDEIIAADVTDLDPSINTVTPFEISFDEPNDSTIFSNEKTALLG